MSVYRRVTYADRCQIFAFIAVKKNVREVGLELGFHPSTIYRELKRNSNPKYNPDHAESIARQRFRQCRRLKTIRGEVEIFVRKRLQERWSPEQIAGRARREKQRGISHETIYRYIRSRPEERKLWKSTLRRYRRGNGFWRRGGKPRHKWMTSIRERPKIIEQRGRYGDWERDTMYGKDRRMLLVCSERKSKLVKITRVTEPYCLHLTDQTKALLEEASYRPLRSITNDNGSELLDGGSFNVPVYYCEPRKPQQRGTVENTIGLLRQYLPKGCDLSVLNEEELKRIEMALNLRPKKCLDWRTPYEVFFEKSVALAM